MPPRSSKSSLEPPRLSTELIDPGASGLESSDGEEYFSDASEGRKRISRPQTPASPIPRTRVERVDDVPSHGQVPGTEAYEKRRQDAVPDEVEVVPEGSLSRRASRQDISRPVSPGGTLIPKTVVEKVDPGSPSHGEIPGTEAYKKRLADSAPDVITKFSLSAQRSSFEEGNNHRRTPSGQIIPETIVTKVDDEPAYGEVAGTRAAELRKKDASPDVTEIKGDIVGSSTFDRFMTSNNNTMRRRSTIQSVKQVHEDDDDGFGDDFDEFEEGAQAGADDDFGDFDDGFQEPHDDDEEDVPSSPIQSFDTSFNLIDMDALSSLPDLLAATQSHFDAMFPSTTQEKQSSLPKPAPIPQDSPIFSSDRSRSLWKQLITPPPLQPPNWTQSRIRRLFLISLGVPVDLDEILPPSKQKKLILPDINLDSTTSRKSTDISKQLDSISRLKQSSKNDSSISLDSQHSTQTATSTSKSKSTSKRGPSSKTPAPPPHLDLASVKRICATTDEKLDGFTDGELQSHVKELESLMETTKEVLEYWLKRKDEIRKEKEAFEGVIENLVRHARRVRK